jgi:Uma2 family endonuclease
VLVPKLTLEGSKSDPSLAYDLTEKKNEYEKAGVREYWVVDVTDKTVFVFQMEQDHYAILGAKSTGVLQLQALPEVTIEIADLF